MLSTCAYRLTLAILFGWACCAAHASAANAPEPLVIERAEFVISDRASPPGDDAAWSMVALPHDWRTLEKKGRLTGWYRIRFKLERVPKEGRGIYLRHLRANAIDVYVNGERYSGSRDIHGRGAQAYGFSLALFAPAILWRPGENVVHFQMNGLAIERALHGLGRVSIGDTHAIGAMRARDFELTGGSLRLAFAATLTAGVLTLILWIARRSDRVMLWFCISCLSWALANVPNYYLRGFAPAWLLDTANAYVRFGMAVPAFILVLRLAGKVWPRVEAALGLYLLLAITSLSWAPLVPATIREHWLMFVWWPTGSAVLLFCGVAILAKWGPHPRSWTFYVEIAALSAMGVFLLQDLAHHLGWIGMEPPIVRHYHVPILVLAIGAAIFERHVAAIWRIERSNEELERRVAAKTQELEAHHDRVRAAEREQALAAERQRIITDMHDGLGASLVGLLRQVQAGRTDAAGIERRVHEALQEMRIAIDALQPRDGDLGTVLGNLRYRLDESIRASGIAFTWEVEELPGLSDLPPTVVFALQRILLEAITNALKHSHARALRVAARARDGNEVEIIVEDDGLGFDPQIETDGVGLASMRARATRIGAKIEFVSRPGAGTAVWLVLPQSARLSADTSAEPQSSRDAPFLSNPSAAARVTAAAPECTDSLR